MHVSVVLPQERPGDPAMARVMASWHRPGRYVPCSVYPLRRGPLRRWRRSGLVWDVVPSGDGFQVASAARIDQLDLGLLLATTAAAARGRWLTWKAQVADTPRARPWESFLADHERSPRTHPLPLVQQRFLAQPRVLTMLAVNAQRLVPFDLNPYDLEALQAGERVYCTLAAHQAVVGQMLVLPHGIVYRPHGADLAHRLNYLRAAVNTVQFLQPDRYLAAVLATSSEVLPDPALTQPAPAS